MELRALAWCISCGKGGQWEGAGIQGPRRFHPHGGAPKREEEVSSEGGGGGRAGLLGRRKFSHRGRILFVLSSFFFKKHKHMVADGAGAVFGWCVLLPLPFAWLSAFFFF